MWGYRILAIICIAALLLAIPNLPYSYYQLLRILIFISAGLIAIKTYQNEKIGWAFTMGTVAILFNPLSPIYF